MKKTLLGIAIVFFSAFLISSCVDDLDEINPPLLADAPQFTATFTQDTVTGGEDVGFTLSVIDAPGGISDSIVVNPESEVSFGNIPTGQSSGEITGTFQAPTDVNGVLTVSFQLFDQQEERMLGASGPKGSTVTADIFVQFPLDPPSVDIAVADPVINRGESTDVIVDFSVPGGIASVIIFADQGTIVQDSAIIGGAIGQAEGSFSLLYNSDLEFTGDVTMTVILEDAVTGLTTMATTTLTAEFAFPAPTVELAVGDKEFKEYDIVDLSVDIDAPGIIDTVFVESFESLEGGTRDTVGTAILDAAEVAAAIGMTSASINGTFESDQRGFQLIRVTVIDEEGRMGTDEFEVFVEDCAATDISGMYATVSSGESAIDTIGTFSDLRDTIEISTVDPNMFDVDDLTFGFLNFIDEEDEPGDILICDGEIIRFNAATGFVETLGGMINQDGTITIEWSREGDGSEGDIGSVSATVELTPLE